MSAPDQLLATCTVLTLGLGGAILLGMAILTRAEEGPGRIPAFTAAASGLAFGAALLAFLQL